MQNKRINDEFNFVPQTTSMPMTSARENANSTSEEESLPATYSLENAVVTVAHVENTTNYDNNEIYFLDSGIVSSNLNLNFINFNWRVSEQSCIIALKFNKIAITLVFLFELAIES